jgi:hypothetical protein
VKLELIDKVGDGWGASVDMGRGLAPVIGYIRCATYFCPDRSAYSNAREYFPYKYERAGRVLDCVFIFFLLLASLSPREIHCIIETYM